MLFLLSMVVELRGPCVRTFCVELRVICLRVVCLRGFCIVVVIPNVLLALGIMRSGLQVLGELVQTVLILGSFDQNVVLLHWNRRAHLCCGSGARFFERVGRLMRLVLAIAARRNIITTAA